MKSLRKIFLMATTVLGAIYSVFAISYLEHLFHLEAYRPVLWLSTFCCYIVAGFILSNLIKDKTDHLRIAVLIAIVFVLLIIFSSNYQATAYLLSHSFYGFLCSSIVIYLRRK